MPVSVRLDPETEKRLRRLVQVTGRTKSTLIREAIERFDRTLQDDTGPSTYERLRKFIGAVDLGGEVTGRGAEEALRAGFGHKDRR